MKSLELIAAYEQNRSMYNLYKNETSDFLIERKKKYLKQMAVRDILHFRQFGKRIKNISQAEIKDKLIWGKVNF